MDLFRLFISLNFAVTFFHCAASHQVRAGYWLSSSGHYSPLSSIDASLYTHLYYYSVQVDAADSTLALPPPENLPHITTFSTTIKTKNCSVKTILSVGTESHKSNAAFSAIAQNPDLRASFINSTIEMAKKHSFDGLDLAWHFPSSSSDMANLGVLLAEWRSYIENSHSALLLTATVYFSDHLFNGPDPNLDYPVEAISRNTDWINVMCFGYHKNSMIAIADDPLIDRTSHSSTSYGIESWFDSGVDSLRLVMGIPLYGRSWYLKNKDKNQPGAQVVAAGPRQKQSNQSGIMAYFEIEEIFKEASSSFVYDNQTVSSYLHSGGLWVSFDSPEVVKEKIKFARRRDLLGYFLYPISFDNSNHTLSKQAIEAWERYEDLGSFYGDDRSPSPEGSSHIDESPAKSTDSSNSQSCFRDTNNLMRCSVSPWFLLLLFVLIKM